MSALFSQPNQPKVPTFEDDELEEERRRQLAIRQKSEGRSSTILTGGGGITAPILGTSATLISGGI